MRPGIEDSVVDGYQGADAPKPTSDQAAEADSELAAAQWDLWCAQLDGNLCLVQTVSARIAGIKSQRKLK